MAEQTAFSVLEELAARARQVDRGMPQTEHALTHWTGLGFSLLGQRFVAPMEEVAEITRVPQVTRLPGVKPFVIGVSNVRGRLMIILDLAMFIGEGSALPRAQRRVLAVEQEEQFIGLLIDESLGMQHFPSDAYIDEADVVEETFRPYARGGYRVGGTVWPVMSLAALAQHPGLQQLAQNS